jgi:general secretion pathway protein D
MEDEEPVRRLVGRRGAERLTSWEVLLTEEKPMQELTTAASLVGYETIESGDAITAVLPRAELETALQAAEPVGFWLEFAQEYGADTTVTVELADADIEAILGSTEGEDVVLALDAEALAGMLSDPEVEAHGVRGALAVAAVTAAIAAPTGVAASPQNADAAATAQRARAATSVQNVDAAATAQVTRTQVTKAQVTKAQVTKAQVTKAQVAKAQVTKAQVASRASTAQATRSLRLKASGVKLLRSTVR